jgi:hypothetical protein
MSEQAFSSLHLHDATLQSIVLDWERKTCRFEILALPTTGAFATRHVLEFTGVASLVVPHTEGWGPSSSILSCSQSSDSFSVVMQSGDTIQVVAVGYSYAAA